MTFHLRPQHALSALLVALATALAAPLAHSQGAAAGPDQRFAPATSGIQARFGHALDGAGDRALVGAIGDGELGTDAGAAHVFERSGAGATWLEAGKLLASDGEAGDEFGYDVALEGDRALVGAHGWDGAGVVDAGAAYVFERQADGVWLEMARLESPVPAPFAHLGWSVDLEGDRALVGAVSDSGAGVFAGAAHLFERQGDGSWSHVAVLTDPDAQFGDSLGHTVALNGDSAFVGALLDDDAGDSAGAVHVFERAADGTWNHTDRLTASDATASARFGQSLAVNGDTLVVGTWINDGADPGRAYLFERDPSGAWLEAQRLTGIAGSDFFGFGVAADLVGDLCVIGTRRISFGASGPGMVRCYERRSDGQWHWVADVAPSSQDSFGRFGAATAVIGPDEFLTGAWAATTPTGQLSGAAYSTRIGQLMRTRPEVSIDDAGTTDLVLFAGPERAGSIYFVVGSYTGTSLGFEVDGVTLPIDRDSYTDQCVFDYNGAILTNNLGLLDGDGTAVVHFRLPKGLDPALAGVRIWHAAVVISPPVFWPPALVTEPIDVALVP
ncbi:hypothetical protein Pla163_00590 [Planctomycetes bacterium Pla163]|uniref:FG-GAP repeat protein n=1 Tax=Rohdeia mirabilis TaxID=2528008 RepID=A0A518CUT9_9BACT|nr:hypothetical protein Pla163_00590 [Planctomycetes bacterium Pla163]